MKLSYLLKSTSLIRRCETDTEISHITPDPKLCRHGTLYVCINGFNRDGHTFIDQAICKGASAVVIECGHPEAERLLQINQIPYAICDNGRSAESILTSRICGDPHKDLRITAVTGTNGKTSIVAMLEHIYSSAGYQCATLGTLNGKLTTPDPAELYPALSKFRESGITHVFMEASSHALALGKLDPIEFDCAVFTNLTPEHLDFHSSMADYANAKSRLFKSSRRSVINADSPYHDVMSAASKVSFTCSANGRDCDFMARNVKLLGEKGISYDLFANNTVFRIEGSIPGSFSVMNTLEAAACAYIDGVSHRTIRHALKTFAGVRGRLERVALPTNEFSVYIDFAHTPDALKNLLCTVRSFMSKEQRLVLLFGCGGDRDRSKRSSMGTIASAMSDFVIITSDNSRSEPTENIINDIASGFDHDCPYTIIEDRREAIEFAVNAAREGDIIVLAGKGHEEYQILSDGQHPFNERDIVYESVRRNMKNKGLY